jgi:hypothetical protein
MTVVRVSKQLTRGKDKDQFTISDDEYLDLVVKNLKRAKMHYLLTLTLARVQRGKAGKVNAFIIPSTDNFRKQIYSKSLLDAQYTAINSFWANSVLYRIGGRKRTGRKNVFFVRVEQAMLDFFANVDLGDSYRVFETRNGKPVLEQKEVRVTKANSVGTAVVEVHRGVRKNGQLFDSLTTLQSGYATSDTVRDLIHIVRRLNGIKEADGSIVFDATQIDALNDSLNKPCKYVRGEVSAVAKPEKEKKTTRKGPRQGTGFHPVSTKMLNTRNVTWLQAIQNFKAAYARALRDRGVSDSLITKFDPRNISSADIMAMMWFDLSSASDVRSFDLGDDVTRTFKELKDKSVPSALRDKILNEQRIVKEYATLLKEGSIESQKQRAYDRSNKKKALPKARKVAPLK